MRTHFGFDTTDGLTVMLARRVSVVNHMLVKIIRQLQRQQARKCDCALKSVAMLNRSK